MTELPEGISVKEVDGFPGWQMITDGKNRRFVSPFPGVKDISRARFDKLRKRALKENRQILQREVEDSHEYVPPNVHPTIATSEHELFPPHPAPDPTSHPDPSARAMGNQPPPPKEEREQIQEIIDAMPEPELGSRTSKKKTISAKDFAEKLALGLNVGTGILGTVITVPELQIPGKQAMSMSISIAWLMDKHDMLDSPIAHAVASNEELMVWAKLGNDLYDYLKVAAPAVAAKVELMRAKAAAMRSQDNGGSSITNQPAHNPVPSNGHQQNAPVPQTIPMSAGLRPTGPARPIGQ